MIRRLDNCDCNGQLNLNDRILQLLQKFFMTDGLKDYKFFGVFEIYWHKRSEALAKALKQ